MIMTDSYEGLSAYPGILSEQELTRLANEIASEDGFGYGYYAGTEDIEQYDISDRNAVSYSPSVMSQQQAEADRSIEIGSGEYDSNVI